MRGEDQGHPGPPPLKVEGGGRGPPDPQGAEDQGGFSPGPSNAELDPPPPEIHPVRHRIPSQDEGPAGAFIEANPGFAVNPGLGPGPIHEPRNLFPSRTALKKVHQSTTDPTSHHGQDTHEGEHNRQFQKRESTSHGRKVTFRTGHPHGHTRQVVEGTRCEHPAVGRSPGSDPSSRRPSYSNP